MNKITIKATVKADKQKTWDYYTQPNHITKWNFATDDWHCPKASNDLRIGGKFSARMEAKDGSFGFDFEAIYNEIVVGEKFTYILPDSRVVTVNFNDISNSTEVIVAFDPESENQVELQHDGWLAILNNFKKYTELN